MNNEIKEILEQLEWYRKIGKKDVYYPECVLPNKKAFLLLDYITNLQQENERLKEISYNPEETNNNWTIEESELRKAFRERKDYKSRCEKAIEYIQENYNELTDYGYKYEIYDDLLNILQNGSDSK